MDPVCLTKKQFLAALKELVLPELAELKAGLAANSQQRDSVGKRLDDANKRLDDVNAHLVDQSRRIDAVREGLGGRLTRSERD